MKKRFPLHRQMSFRLTCIVIILIALSFFVFFLQLETPLKRSDMQMLPAIFALLTPLLFLLFRHFLKPLDQLTRTTDMILKGDFDSRVPVDGDNELALLHENCNNLAQVLQEKDHALRRLNRELEAGKLDNRQCQARKMEAARLMAGGLAHDLNNILTGIVSYPELLLMKVAEDSPLRQPIESIRNAGQRATDVVTDLQTVASNGRVIKERTDLNNLIHQYLHSPQQPLLRSQHSGINLVTELAEGLKPIACCREHVTTCLSNLIDFGMAAAGKGGTVTVATGNHEVESESSPGQKEYISLAITDTGNALSEEDVSRIFDPFYSKRIMEKNTNGLGMAVAWNIVQEHGGQISVQSSNSGTCFDVRFPVANDGKDIPLAP